MVRSLTALAEEVGEISDDHVLQSKLDSELRDRWRTSASSLAAACLRLEETGPGPSLVHGDLRPWNVTYGSGTTRIFDWTDAAVSHPFVDLATYIFRTDDIAARRRMVDAYLDAWSTVGSMDGLREAVDLADGDRSALPGADLPTPDPDPDELGRGRRPRRRRSELDQTYAHPP